MNHIDMAQQAQVENSLLNSLIEGLRHTLAWKVQGANDSRKLSTLRFIADSFQRHMERVMTLEERDGYMDVVVATDPNLGKTVDALRREHDKFRKGIATIVQDLGAVSSTDQATFTRICADLTLLLKKLDEHHQKETAIFQDVFVRQDGGEG
jgi:hemerythrin-like domain-containing protein